ncbi:hypothetical protein WDU94_009996, partial [Cyamophila willieti]
NSICFPLSSGQTTTAPTLPEDERIPLDEIKEEKVNVDSTAGKKVDMKKEIHMSKIHTGIVKTPDEVADLPVHEEVDATDYEDIEKKDEGIDEEMEEVGEEQEGSTDIMKGSISFITTTRESDDLLNEDGEKPAERTEDDVEKLANDDKCSEDSKDILDKQSKERLNAEKVKSEHSATDEAETKDGMDIKEEGNAINEKLEKDMKNTVILQEDSVTSIKDGTETRKQDDNVDQATAKDAVIVEDPVYGKLKPDHAEYVTVTPDSAPDSPKKTDLSSIQEAKYTTEIADKDPVKIDDAEESKQDRQEEKNILQTEEEILKEDVEKQGKESEIIKNEIEVPSKENEQKAGEENKSVEKMEYIEETVIGIKKEPPMDIEASKENTSSSKSPEDKTIVPPEKSDTKEVNDDLEAEIKPKEIKDEKEPTETKADQEKKTQAEIKIAEALNEDKSEKGDPKEDNVEQMVPETKDSEIPSTESKDKIGLDPTKVELDIKSNESQSDLTLSDKSDINHVDVRPHDPSVKSIEEEEEEQGTPPKSPSDRVDSRKTSTESLGNKSTTESILSAEQTEELDKDQTLSKDPKLVKADSIGDTTESVLGKKDLNTSETPVLSSIELKMSKEKVDLKSEDAATKSTSKEPLDEKLDILSKSPKNVSDSNSPSFLTLGSEKDISPSKPSKNEPTLSTPPKSPKESSGKSSPSKSQTEEASQIERVSLEGQKLYSSPPKSPNENYGKSIIEDKPTSPSKSPIKSDQSKTDKPLPSEEKVVEKEATLHKSPEKISGSETFVALSETKKDTERTISPPSLESSKESEKIASPPKSPTDKVEPSKGTEKVPSPPKSPMNELEASKETEKLPRPPNSPTEKLEPSKDTGKAPSPPKSPTDKVEPSEEQRKSLVLLSHQRTN